MIRSARRLIAIFGAAAVVHFCAAGALAQAQKGVIRPPKAEEPEEVHPTLMYLGGLACALIAVATGVMPSRRTHQD